MPDATVHVYTYKDGLLARLAHDLRLAVRGFSATLDHGRVEASLDPRSARVEGVASGDRVDAGALSEKDRRSIEATLVDDILGPAPLTYVGTVSADGALVRGRLTMKGRTEALDLPVRARNGLLEVDVTVVPSRWGIAPYRALAGALRLQDRWRVRALLPWTGTALPEATTRWSTR